MPSMMRCRNSRPKRFALLKTRPFDPCNYLHDPADVSAYLKVAAEEAAARHDLNSLLEAVATARRALAQLGPSAESGS